MKIKSFRAVVLISVTTLVLLTACDDGPTERSAIPPADDEMISQLLSMQLAQARPPSWSGAYLAARVAQQRFDWPRAFHFLERTAELKPGQMAIDRRLMLLAAGSGEMDKAIATAKKINSTEDPSGLTHLILLMEPLRAGQLITARTMVDNLPQSSLVNYLAPILRAWISAGEGKADLSALRGNRSYFYHHVLLADYLNQIERVADVASLVPGQNTLSGIAAERMGDIFLRHKNYETAASLYRLALAISPNLSDLGIKLKAAQNKQADVSLLSLAPPVSNPAAGIAMAFLDMATTFYNDQGDESAQLFARMALDLDPGLIEARLLLGHLLARGGRIDSAIAVYNQVPETAPRYLSVRQQVAALLVSQDRDAEAVQALEKLIPHAPDTQTRASILVQIGDIHRENESFEAALAAYDQAFRVLGTPPAAQEWELLYARGMTLERLKRWEAAEKDLLAALEFQPGHPYVMNYLAYSWADRGLHLDRALEMLLKAVSIVPQDGYVTDSVGWAYYKMRKYPEAVDYLERAVELLPYDATVNDHLGDAYARVGRMREARFQWNRAMNFGKDETEIAKIKTKIETGLVPPNAP